MKNTLYEGGVRGVGWVHSSLLKRPGLVSRRLMYVTDWLATLLAVAGLTSLLPAGTDSLDMWPSLQLNKASPREEIVLNLDQDTYWDSGLRPSGRGTTSSYGANTNCSKHT